MVILPPYNNLWAQVVKRGNPPEIVTEGLTVEYRIEGNSYSYGKAQYGTFWDGAAQKLASPAPAVNIGLTGNGLSGVFKPAGEHFVADGIPVVPVMDSGTWNPYQTAVVTVKNSAGTVLAETKATVPISDEMNCAKCHGSDSAGSLRCHPRASR